MYEQFNVNCLDSRRKFTGVVDVIWCIYNKLNTIITCALHTYNNAYNMLVSKSGSLYQENRTLTNCVSNIKLNVKVHFRQSTYVW